MEGEPRGRRVVRLVALVVVLVALAAFVIQNTEKVQFNWLLIDITMPL